MSGSATTGPLRLVRAFFLSTTFLSLGFGCVAGLMAIMAPHWANATPALLISSSVVGLIYSALCLIAVNAIRKGCLPVFGWLAITTLTLAVVLWLYLFSLSERHEQLEREEMARIIGTLSVVGGAISLSLSMAVLPRRSTIVRLLVAFEILSVCSLALLALVLMWTTWLQEPMRNIWAGLYGWGAATLVGLLMAPGIARRHDAPRRAPKETIPSKISIEMTCPRCSAEQVLPTGATSCRACRYALVIEIEEPRCDCGYLLYRLAGESCPECGKEIPVAARWGERKSSTFGEEGP